MDEPENPAMVNLAHMGSLQGVAIRAVEFSNGGYKIGKIFCLIINIPKGDY